VSSEKIENGSDLSDLTACASPQGRDLILAAAVPASRGNRAVTEPAIFQHGCLGHENEIRCPAETNIIARAAVEE
jgi:hypothetical protein